MELTELVDSIDLFFAQNQHPLTVEEKNIYAALMRVSREGHLCLNISGFNLKSNMTSPAVVVWGDNLYLKRNFEYETSIIRNLKRVMNKREGKFEGIVKGSGLTKAQEKAVEVALSNTVTIIEGGPGTGKSFLTEHLVKAFLKIYGESAEVILTAPTSKAVARLRQCCSYGTYGTLHAMLGVSPFRNWDKGKGYIGGDLIIVDESSMIEARLFAFLLASLRTDQRIVFLGDGNQLPPVESGSVFMDLIDLVPTVHLERCLRSDREEILGLSKKILCGQMIQPHYPLSDEYIYNLAMKYYESRSSSHRFVILSPVNEGPFGVREVNQKILNFFLFRMGIKDLLAVPIFITKTTEVEGVRFYNGETGFLWRTKEEELYAEFREGDKRVAPLNLPPYQPSYALSVHMSQGSEFDTVVVLIPPGTGKFGWQLLYTAVTRAKSEVVICGEASDIETILNRSTARISGIKERWTEVGG